MSDGSLAPSQKLYSLKELCAGVENERRNSAFADEQVDQLEINRLFTARRGRAKARPVPPAYREEPLEAEAAKMLDDAISAKDVMALDRLVSEGIINKNIASRKWSEAIDFPYVDPFQSIVTPDAVASIPSEIAEKAMALPLYVFDNVLTVAMATPQDESLVRRIAAICDLEISPVFSLPTDIKAGIAIHFAPNESIEQSIEAFENVHGNIEHALESMGELEMADAKPISAILDAVLHLAIRERASDIHLEPFEIGVRIRFRVDGKLHEVRYYSHAVHRAVAARLRVLCKVNVAESRFPQDGRFSMPLGTGTANFRVSIRPVARGSNVVIRILGGTGRRKLMSLESMLISSDIITPYKQVVQSPNGLIFVTGPTGSGKTSLLYASLESINNGEINITTIEDPIEVEIPGIAQSQVNSHIDLSFPLLLRSMLRQDPDVILVGEIRDLETARIATEAALTGHLVFATLHTNNAIQAVVRLIEIGIEPYMVAPSINAVVAQRLAPRLNPRFREPYVPSSTVLNEFFNDWEQVQDFTFYRPRNDDDGLRFGFQGRIAFHEIAIVNDRMRSLIGANAGVMELREAAEEMGYRPLRYDGLKKALLGLTTIEEIARATPQEWESK
ncbi:GspE/PulE family protein [Cerasicoccus fimbriatus]|uniref:GspE/PulE family protein n=1 Tax=Cerasicoccus fimbriatus TaxID=3014554 RepID=UPI0022B59145|nr:GspE/PulE family protein [Cerasicoccus sp. TK19100]